MTKGYQNYHGRMPGWKKWLIIISIVVVALAAVFLLLQKYQVFDADGVHWNIPFFSQTDASGSTAEGSVEADPNENLIITIEEPKIPYKEIHAAAMAASLPVGEWAAEVEGLTADGADAFCITLKTPDGNILYRTEDGGVDESMKTSVSDLGKATYLIADISCFADTAAANAMPTMAVMSVNGTPWRSPESACWLDPYSEDAQAYLLQIVQECVEMGVSEIVLDDVCFPTVGTTSRIDYPEGADSPEQRVAAIDDFLDAIRTQLGDSGVKLSVVIPAELVTTPVNTASGQDLNAILARADRVYCPAASQEEADTLRSALAPLDAERDATVFVVIAGASAYTGGSYLIVGE